jgi:hypothetical protein
MMTDKKTFDAFAELSEHFSKYKNFMDTLQKDAERIERDRNNRDEMILAMAEMADFERGICDTIADAIIAGEIPHVKYEG